MTRDSMTDINIREAGPQDLQSLIRLHAMHVRHQDSLDQFSELTPTFDSSSQVRDWLLQGSNQFFLAEIRGQAVGFIRLTIQAGSQVIPIRPSLEPLSSKLSFWRILNRLLSFITGPVSARMAKPPWNNPMLYGYLADIYLIPEAQGKGLGNKLLEHAMQWFGQKKIDLVFLQVLEDNKQGKKFWEKSGFKPNKAVMVKRI